MPTVEQNIHQWSNHHWSTKGDDWSEWWGTPAAMWRASILPRICHYLPATHILEIAPGQGRCTQFLLPECREITLVDIVPECIEKCVARFKRSGVRVHGHVNDGRSLEMVRDGSIDFVFSWDSLVHVEEDVMRDYIAQLGSKLKPGAAGFLHHSNLGAYERVDGSLMVENKHWRAQSMSAAKFGQFAAQSGLVVVAQELIPWGQESFNDCFTAFVRPRQGMVAREQREVPIVENARFIEEARWITQLCAVYHPEAHELYAPASVDRAPRSAV